LQAVVVAAAVAALGEVLTVTVIHISRKLAALAVGVNQ
tara:strand:+ start:192 stop:305 length:114 start_codon:yes stop_codon:yes gene_type:complete